MLDGLGRFSNWFQLGAALSYQSENQDHWKTFFSDSLWKSNILAIPHFSKMDSKRDHRGGHRNIYDQIDLEIINSKGPGPEKSTFKLKKLSPYYHTFCRKSFSQKRFRK